MRRTICIAVVAALFALLFPLSVSAVVVDGIAIIVNKDAVLVSEINEALMPLMQEYRSKYAGAELQKKLAELRETIITQAIENKLILQVAKERGITPSEKDIDSRIEMVKNRFPSEEDFIKTLAARGVTYREYRDQVGEQVLVQQAMQAVLNPNIEVLDNEIREYYDAHLKDFVTEPKVKLAQIFLSVPGGASPEAIEDIRRQARQLRVLIEDGMDFGELASHYSEGPQGQKSGLIGVVGKNEILPELEDIAFNLKSDEVSPIIQTTYGFHILKALEAVPARKVGYEEAKPLIEERLRETKRSAKYKEWIQELRNKAFIEVKL